MNPSSSENEGGGGEGVENSRGEPDAQTPTLAPLTLTPSSSSSPSSPPPPSSSTTTPMETENAAAAPPPQQPPSPSSLSSELNYLLQESGLYPPVEGRKMARGGKDDPPHMTGSAINTSTPGPHVRTHPRSSHRHHHHHHHSSGSPRGPTVAGSGGTHQHYSSGVHRGSSSSSSHYQRFRALLSAPLAPLNARAASSQIRHPAPSSFSNSNYQEPLTSAGTPLFTVIHPLSHFSQYYSSPHSPPSSASSSNPHHHLSSNSHSSSASSSNPPAPTPLSASSSSTPSSSSSSSSHSPSTTAPTPTTSSPTTMFSHPSTTPPNTQYEMSSQHYRYDPLASPDWDAAGAPGPLCAGRVKKDLSTIFTEPLPGIFAVPQDDNLFLVHALIVGPFDTPYEGGLFHFIIRFGPHYPLHPPRVRLLTTGGGNVRFNPNLYKNGKVCLSILGTWPGPAWSPASNLSSILLSLQSLLNERPYFNEPGYDEERSPGDSRRYNTIITHETIRVSVVQQLNTITAAAASTTNVPASPVPPELARVMEASFLEYYDHYVEVCTQNQHMDRQPMEDPFGEIRGHFCYGQLLKALHKLKAKLSASAAATTPTTPPAEPTTDTLTSSEDEEEEEEEKEGEKSKGSDAVRV